MKRIAPILSALILLCTFARAQTQVINAPLGGHIPIMHVDAQGAQHVEAPSYPLIIDAIPLSATSAHFEFLETDAPIWWLTNQTDSSATMNANWGIQWSFDKRPWTHRCDSYWDFGFWQADGSWNYHSDVANEYAYKRELEHGGFSNLYVSSSPHVAPGETVYGNGQTCNVWFGFTTTNPGDLAFLKRGDAAGKVTLWLTPRAVFSISMDGMGVDDSECAWRCNYVTSIGSILVTSL